MIGSGSITEVNGPRSVGLSIRTMEPSVGQSVGARARMSGPVYLCPVLIQYPPDSWFGSSVARDRTMVNWSAIAAVRGSNSQNESPGTRVAMGEKTPRISAGASGLGSKVSYCDGPPLR